jgi:hypothetical protein
MDYYDEEQGMCVDPGMSVDPGPPPAADMSGPEPVVTGPTTPEGRRAAEDLHAGEYDDSVGPTRGKLGPAIQDLDIGGLF